VALHCPKAVVAPVLPGNIPGRLAVAAPDTADSQALALTEGVEGKAKVLAHAPACWIKDWTGAGWQELLQKGSKGALTDKTDSRGILFERIGQAKRHGDATHSRFAQTTQRENTVRKLRLIQAVQEVTLVLVDIDALEQPKRRFPLAGGCSWCGCARTRCMGSRAIRA